MVSPTFAESPFFLRTFPIVPESGEGSSTVAFSLSSVTRGSSFLTGSPGFLSHSPISTSVIDSPISGTFNSMGIDDPFGHAERMKWQWILSLKFYSFLTEGALDDFGLLVLVPFG